MPGDILAALVDQIADAVAERLRDRPPEPRPAGPPVPVQSAGDGRLLLTSAEAANRLGVGPRTVERLAIPKCRLGRCVRYDVADVQRFIDSRKSTEPKK